MRKINFLTTFLAILLTISSCKKEDVSNPIHINSIKSQSQSIIKSTLSMMDNPVLVWSSSNQPSPSTVAPAIFYTPHQDDETIGMGASISEHARAGKPVYVVLLTNGGNKKLLAYLKTLNPKATMQDLMDARNNEFIAACKALGVHRVYIANSGSGYDESTSSFLKLKEDFKSTMKYMRDLFPGASHKTVSGNCDSRSPKCDKMPTHQVAANAIHELYNEGLITDVKLYRVYCYWHYKTCDRNPSWDKPVAAADKARRKKAINQYKYVNTSIQRYGLGYWHSVKSLFDNSWSSDYEYVDYIENDY